MGSYAGLLVIPVFAIKSLKRPTQLVEIELAAMVHTVLE